MNFDEEIRQVTLLPYQEYRPETTLVVGEIGLYMSAVAYDLFAKSMEMNHAQEYILAQKQKDVAETVEAYKERLENMAQRLEEKRKKLEQCPKEDEKVIRAVSAFLDKMSTGLHSLTQAGDILCDKEITCEDADGYYRLLDILYQAADQYIRLHIGDVHYL